MKFLVTILCLCAFHQFPAYGQNRILFTIPAGSDLMKIIPPEDIFLYPSFTKGRVFYKNGGSSGGLLNYNILLGEMQFINTNGDTLSVANENTINYLTINQDTFYYNKIYLQKISGNDNIKLACQKAFTEVERNKVGAYDQTTTSSAIGSYTSIILDGQIKKLTVRENTILTKTNSYYLGTRYNTFTRYTKKNLLKNYSKFENEIKDYLEKNSISFTKEEDLKKLTQFLATLIQ